MKHGHKFLIGALVVVALATALALLAPGGRDSLAVNGTIHCVDVGAMGDNDGSSWNNAYTDLQAALDAAEPGDVIWVAAGIYKPTSGTDRTASFQMKNGVTIYGGFDPSVGDIAFEDRDWVANESILSGDLDGDDGPDFTNNGENSYHVFYHPGGTDLDGTAILDGFTITGGNADGTFPHVFGGGMYNHGSSPTLINCTFAGNSADDGGGLYNYQSSSPVLTECTFIANSAAWHGGGIYNVFTSAPELTGCTFEDNSANRGGGMDGLFSSPVLTDCTFEGNSATEYGGGMYNSNSSPTLTGCTFDGNSAYDGGGIYNKTSSPVLTSCTFAGNMATEGGGGVHNSSSSPELTGCTFSGNSAHIGGGMRNSDSAPDLVQCTFEGNSAGNSGGGMYNGGSSPTLNGCIFEGNSAFGGGGMINFSSTPTLTDCTFSVNTGGGMANFSSSPVLVGCTFVGNTDDHWGGGMSNAFSSSPVLTNCTFAGNWAGISGGGIYNQDESSPGLTNCTFSGNHGGAIFNRRQSSPVIANCILWGDGSDEIVNEDLDSAPVVTYSDVLGGYEGEGNIEENPLFADAASGDFHLQLDSPCIDAGTNEAPHLPDLDFEGDARILDGDGNVTRIVDMGVDEVAAEWSYFYIYLPLVLRAYE